MTGVEPIAARPCVFVFTPMALGYCNAYYARSWSKTIAELIKAGISHAYLAMESTGIVAARNEAVRAVMENPQFTHLLFLDADMGWEPASAIVEMIRADEDVVCGVYPSRGENCFWTCVPITDEPNKKGLIELQKAPTGMMLLKRGVLEKIAKERPDLQTRFCGVERDSWLMFDQRRSKDGKEYMTDDYGFCETWTDLGGKIYAYPNVTIDHAWLTVNRGNLADWIKEQKEAGQPCTLPEAK